MLLHNVKDIRDFFIGELNDGEFTIDKTGQKTIELFGASFIASAPAIFGEPVKDYIDAEISWYESQSTNINNLLRFMVSHQLLGNMQQMTMARSILTMAI